MDLKELSKPLSIKDIDFRIQSVNNWGKATILAYKDARVDMNRLDQVCGALNWKREHVNNNANCIISVWCEEKKEWVSKEDTGTESFTEKAKGLASDSFKRAAFNWGIGRELYDYPIIKIDLIAHEKGKELNKNDKAKFGEWYVESGKAKGGFGLKIKEWVWFSQFTENKLTYLACKDQAGTKRFSFGKYIEPKKE